ncbi:hypothetical protein [Burkholderia multivorans]|uniref:hypothetical protein n=1 Tax=Burkholderia multivorans TaxID=87883 RepID=UPI001C6150CA|nr:hypothetical protein [Burkholderia multivorans]
MEVDSDAMPVEVDVDSDVTELLVELRPVDSDPIELFADERPVEAEVDSEEMLLDVAVDSEPMEGGVKHQVQQRNH